MEAHQQSMAVGLAQEALERQEWVNRVADENTTLHEESQHLRTGFAGLQANLAQETAQRQGLEAELAKEAANRQRVEREVQQLRAQLANVTADNQHLAGQVAELTTGQGQIRACTRRLEAQADKGTVLL